MFYLMNRGKMQVMAPSNPSHKSREEFVQWNEPAMVIGNDKHGTCVASPSALRVKEKAIREKVIVEAPVASVQAVIRLVGWNGQPTSNLKYIFNQQWMR